MDRFNYYNKSYLYSIKPKYNSLIYTFLILIITLSFCLYIFETYDIYSSKGYLECNDICNISIYIDPLNVSKIDKIDFIKLNNNNLIPNNIKISEIKVEENNQSNYQIVSYQVDKLDYGLLNTFQDVKIYSNKEKIINKIIKYLF